MADFALKASNLPCSKSCDQRIQSSWAAFQRPWHPAFIRGKDDQLRAFKNVCRHRASRILEGQGSCPGVIRCPYHGWTYQLDGSLMAIPQDEISSGNLEQRVPRWMSPIARITALSAISNLSDVLIIQVIKHE